MDGRNSNTTNWEPIQEIFATDAHLYEPKGLTKKVFILDACGAVRKYAGIGVTKMCLDMAHCKFSSVKSAILSGCGWRFFSELKLFKFACARGYIVDCG
jgi:hypothetical protein